MQLDKQYILGLKIFIFLGLALGLTQCGVQSKPEEISVVEAEMSQPILSIQNWPDDVASVARIHIVLIPPNYPVEVAVGEGLKTVEEFAADTSALAVINGGFFDPNNGQTTSFITVNGTLVADPRDNSQLIDNPELAIYMDQILNRSEFRRYNCGEDMRYDITLHTEVIPDGCSLHSAMGAGPQVLPNDTSQLEGFTDYIDSTLIRDSIGLQQRNARSAIGIKQDGTLVWVMVAQVETSGGMTLSELSKFMASLDVQKALNLDGGSSSSLYWAWPDGAHDKPSQPYYGRLDQSGQTVQRPIKSVLLLPREMEEFPSTN